MEIVLTADRRSHSAHQELIEAPPPGVRYTLRPLHWGNPLGGGKWRDRLRWMRHGARLRLMGPGQGLPIPDWGAPIHSTSTAIVTKRPWVCDFEHVGAFVGFEYDALLRPRVRRRLARNLGRARALLAWTDLAANGLRVVLPDLGVPVHTVPPATRPVPRRSPPDFDDPLILFVGRRFESKGGPEALDAFQMVRRRHPKARLLMVTPAPTAERPPQGVEFWSPDQPRERLLRDAFAHAAAFLLPTQYDTFGMVFLEAFAHALPVVTLDGFAMEEIVSDGIDGFRVPGYTTRWFLPDGTHNPIAWRWPDVATRRSPGERRRVVRDLADRLDRLLADPRKARAMGRAGLAKVTEGRFSLPVRNKALLGAYRVLGD